MYVISPGGELVGYSEWPWDRLYTPVIGLFWRGRLQAFAPCDQEPQKVSLKGPAIRCWFRLRPSPDLLARLLQHDPEVRLARLEDGSVVKRGGQVGSLDPTRLVRVEEMLSGGETSKPAQLDGFAAFLGAPVGQQMECLYLDYFGRALDSGGFGHYGNKVVSGELSIIAVRNALMLSEEWINRGVTLGERVGSMLTSHMWCELSGLQAPGQRFRSLPTFRIRDYDALGGEGFVEACYELFLERPVDPIGLAHYVLMSETNGRLAVAVELSREAAHRGVFLNVVEA